MTRSKLARLWREDVPRVTGAPAESKWPCFFCGSRQAHHVGWIGGSSMPVCAAHRDAPAPPDSNDDVLEQLRKVTT